MTAAPAKKLRTMPKGGRKGGSVFPRVTLGDAVGYARKLVSKTHTSAQPKDVIFSGVVGAKAGKGDVRISALKQYGFLTGDTKSNFTADALAKKITAAPAEELAPLYQQAMLKPTVFKKLFDTFTGDAVSKAKLKQRAADLKVHPDETGTCVDIYVSGMTTAGLVTIDGDQIRHLSSSELSAAKVADVGADEDADSADMDAAADDEADNSDEDAERGEDVPRDSGRGETAKDAPNGKAARPVGPRAVFSVNVTLDSSLDIEKLQKQLELLKRFGAL